VSDPCACAIRCDVVRKSRSCVCDLFRPFASQRHGDRDPGAGGGRLRAKWTVSETNDPKLISGDASAGSKPSSDLRPGNSPDYVDVSVGDGFSLLLASAHGAAYSPGPSSANSGWAAVTGLAYFYKQFEGPASIDFIATWDIVASASASGPGSSAQAHASGSLQASSFGVPGVPYIWSNSLIAWSTNSLGPGPISGSLAFSMVFDPDAAADLRSLWPIVMARGRAEVVPEPSGIAILALSFCSLMFALGRRSASRQPRILRQ
jgi:hypothetical protein